MDDPGEEEELRRRKKTDGHVTNLEKKSCSKVGPRKEKEKTFWTLSLSLSFISGVIKYHEKLRLVKFASLGVQLVLVVWLPMLAHNLVFVVIGLYH